jgi:hypothetical protein
MDSTVIFSEMNRFFGFALIGGLLLVSSATASGAGANQMAHQGRAYLAAPAVQESMASASQPLPAVVTSTGRATATQRIIHASQPSTLPALPPASAEVAPASQASPTPCVPARTDIACRKP